MAGPFAIESLRAIQLSKSDVLETLEEGPQQFTTAEWKDFLLRSIGLEPTAMSDRAKMVVLLRMIPFVERNYNLVELGPRGTGKSHLFQQISPYSHLISGRQGDRREDVREQRPAASAGWSATTMWSASMRCPASRSTRRTA